MAKHRTDSGPCPLKPAIAVFANKWKPALLFHLFKNETLRHSELRRLLPEVSQRVMTLHLRELERDGFVTRTESNEVPPRVEYAATKLAQSIIPLFESIEEWDQAHMEEVESCRQRYDDNNRF